MQLLDLCAGHRLSDVIHEWLRQVEYQRSTGWKRIHSIHGNAYDRVPGGAFLISLYLSANPFQRTRLSSLGSGGESFVVNRDVDIRVRSDSGRGYFRGSQCFTTFGCVGFSSLGLFLLPSNVPLSLVFFPDTGLDVPWFGKTGLGRARSSSFSLLPYLLPKRQCTAGTRNFSMVDWESKEVLTLTTFVYAQVTLFMMGVYLYVRPFVYLKHPHRAESHHFATDFVLPRWYFILSLTDVELKLLTRRVHFQLAHVSAPLTSTLSHIQSSCSTRFRTSPAATPT